MASAKAPHHDKKGRHAPFPYALFKFSQAWADHLAHAAFNFGRYFVYNSLLQFYVEELGTSAVAAGQHILVGQIFDCIGKFGFAPFADRAIRNNPASRTRVRKVISGTAFVAFAASMAGLAVSYSVAAATCWLIVAKIASISTCLRLQVELFGSHTNSQRRADGRGQHDRDLRVDGLALTWW